MNQPRNVAEVLAAALMVEVNGGELESITTVYTREGVGFVLAHALGVPPDTPVAHLRANVTNACCPRCGYPDPDV